MSEFIVTLTWTPRRLNAVDTETAALLARVEERVQMIRALQRAGWRDTAFHTTHIAGAFHDLFENAAEMLNHD